MMKNIDQFVLERKILTERRIATIQASTADWIKLKRVIWKKNPNHLFICHEIKMACYIVLYSYNALFSI